MMMLQAMVVVMMMMVMMLLQSRTSGRQGQDTVQRSRADQPPCTLRAQGAFFNLHQLRHEPNVGTHARPLRQNVVVGLVEGPMQLRDQIRNRRRDRSRLARFAMYIDRCVHR